MFCLSLQQGLSQSQKNDVLTQEVNGKKKMTQDLSKKKQEVVAEDTERCDKRRRGRAFVLSAPAPAYLTLPTPSPISNLTGIPNEERGLNCKIRTLPKQKIKSR